MKSKSITHYKSSHKILLVGEGDFSFSLCLAKAFGSASNMVATSLDTRAFLTRKYTRALCNLVELEVLGCTILHEVDVNKMKQHHYLKYHNGFDRIIFNFPHYVGFGLQTNPYMIEQFKEVVTGFLGNAKYMLSSFGEIHVTNKTVDSICNRNIKNLAEIFGLSFIEEVEFHQFLYPGYEYKMGTGWKPEQSFPIGKCSTFKFRN